MKPSICRRRRSARPKLAFEKLEERKLLATLDILAAGTSGTEQINLYVDNQVVATFDDLGTGAYANRFNTLSYESEEPISAGDVRIEFVNDAYTPVYRDVQIDAIVIDGQRFEAESPDVYSTGTWKREDGVVAGYRESEFLQVNGYFQFADPIAAAANSPDVFHRSFDPNVGTILTAFADRDPQNPQDPWDILTSWKSAIDELESIGVDEVTFAVYRYSEGGYLSGGPTIETVTSAVEYANERGFSVTMLPLFETEDGWRGDYDPTGTERTIFRNEYTQLISDLAQIEGIDRFSIVSELNAMVNNTDNHAWIQSLVPVVESAFESVGNTSGRIGATANFDAYDNRQHTALLTTSGLDYVGLSAYYSVLDRADANLVAGVGEVSESTFERLVDNWTGQLDRLSAFGSENGLSVVIQEFGAVQQNYAAVAPFAVTPGNWVNAGSPDQFTADPQEQAALYESLIEALDGRAEEFESVVFWTWEHGASRGTRSYIGAPAGTPQYIEAFAIWPTDGGAGEYLTSFLSTSVDGPVSTVGIEVLGTEASDSLRGEQLDDVLQGFGGDDILFGDAGDDELHGGAGNDQITAGEGNDRIFGGSYRDTIWGNEGNDTIDAGSGFDEVFGGQGDDTIDGHWGNDTLDGGEGNDRIDGGVGNDTIFGQSGSDVLDGGDGNDTIHGGSEQDTISGGEGDDTIHAGTHADSIHGDAGDDTIWASSGWDVVWGGQGNDQIHGEWGNDTLHGGIGDDVLNGGVGNDNLDGGEGFDRALFSGNQADYTITLNEDGSYQVAGIDGVDTLTGIESIVFEDGEVTLGAPQSARTLRGFGSATNPNASTSRVDQSENTIMPHLSGSVNETDLDSDKEENESLKVNNDLSQTDDFFASLAIG